MLRISRDRQSPVDIEADVEIYVDIADSASKNDALCDVVDYNVMRDSLLLCSQLEAANFADAVADHLLSGWPIQAVQIRIREKNTLVHEIFKVSPRWGSSPLG